MNINKLSYVGFIVFSSLVLFFYGIKFLQDETFQKSTFSFNVIFNENPASVKGFKTLQLEANQAKESSSVGVEESTDTGYDVTLTTELAGRGLYPNISRISSPNWSLNILTASSLLITVDERTPFIFRIDSEIFFAES